MLLFITTTTELRINYNNVPTKADCYYDNRIKACLILIININVFQNQYNIIHKQYIPVYVIQPECQSDEDVIDGRSMRMYIMDDL